MTNYAGVALMRFLETPAADAVLSELSPSRVLTFPTMTGTDD